MINKKINLRTITLILIILFISLLPRLWKLTIYPPVIIDKSANLGHINKLIALRAFRPIDYEWDFSMATLVFYPTIALIKLAS